MRTNPLFRVSQAFAPATQADQLLPLYALFAALEELCSQSPEEEVRRRKLEWWRNECLLHPPAASNHPILKVLTRSGASERLDRQQLTELFASAEARLDGASPTDADAFEALCRRTGQPQCALELCLAAPCAKASSGMAAQMGLAQLLRESAAPGAPNRHWWLPLHLLARHGVSRADLVQDVDAQPVRALFAEILQQARAWGTERKPIGGAGATESADWRHLAVHGLLQRRALSKLEPLSPGEYAHALRRVGARDLFAAWKAARRVSRR